MSDETAAQTPSRSKIPRILWIVGGLAFAATVLGFEIRQTRPVRDAVHTYTELISAANRRDLTALRSLCTEHYTATHRIKLAEEGGVVGFPRNIHKNFQAWREGDEVWLCPTNRVGPVFRFVEVQGRWKFDGVVGQLVPGGRVEPLEDENETGS